MLRVGEPSSSAAPRRGGRGPEWDNRRGGRRPMGECAIPELSEVVEAYQGRVLAYARKLLGGAEAEDVAQEVFVKVGR